MVYTIASNSFSNVWQFSSLATTEAIQEAYAEGVRVTDHFELIRAQLEIELADWNRYLLGEKLISSKNERSSTTTRVLDEMTKRSGRIMSLFWLGKLALQRVITFHGDFRMSKLPSRIVTQKRNYIYGNTVLQPFTSCYIWHEQIR